MAEVPRKTVSKTTTSFGKTLSASFARKGKTGRYHRLTIADDEVVLVDDAGEFASTKSGELIRRFSDIDLCESDRLSGVATNEDFGIARGDVSVERGRDFGDGVVASTVEKDSHEETTTKEVVVTVEVTPQTNDASNGFTAEADGGRQDETQIVGREVDIQRAVSTTTASEMSPSEFSKSRETVTGTKRTTSRKKWKRKNRKNTNFETIDDVASSSAGEGQDTETIEMLEIDEDERKSRRKARQRMRRTRAKRMAKTTGTKLWKGLREGLRLMWSGLALYTLPVGSLDVTTNITKIWSTKAASNSNHSSYR